MKAHLISWAFLVAVLAFAGVVTALTVLHTLRAHGLA